MKTIKLPYKIIDDSYNDYIINIIRQQSIVMRWSYNRFIEGLKEKDVRHKVSELNNINDIDSWFIISSISVGKQIKLSNYDKKTNNHKKVIFNKKNYIRRQKNLISNEEYRNSKHNFIYSVGQANNNGNRKFQLDIVNNQILFKPKKEIKIYLELPKLRNNIKKELLMLDQLSKLKQIPITYKLDKKYIYIDFEESKLHDNKNIKTNNLNDQFSNRILSIDLNPNYIGISVLEFNNSSYKVLKAFCYDISKLTNKRSNHNKLKHETIEITNKIINFCKHYHIKYVGIEKLNNLIPKDHNKGKNNNSLLNNKWLRTLFTEQLSKRCRIHNINLYKIGAYYSSYIGNLQHNYFDPINSSIEIGRRTYEIIINKDKTKFYPSNINIKTILLDQWKESINIEVYKCWKELCKEIKNLKLRYRVSLNESSYSYNVLRSSSIKSKVLIIDFM